MIYTITFNPSVDYIVHLDTFNEGDLNRATDTKMYAGGKGINVSRVLHTLGVETTALGFVGGFTGQFIKDYLNNENINEQMIEVDGETRINVKLKTSAESEINASGPAIHDSQLQQLLDQLESLTSIDHVVLSGSVQSSISNAYEVIAALLQKKGIPFTVDAEGTRLLSTLPYGPYLIKPNIHELEAIANKTLNTHDDIVETAHTLLNQGAQNVLVSMGGDGAIFVNHEHQYLILGIKGTLINSVGAGDSTVAGFLSQRDQSITQQITYAISAGSATAFSSDLASIEDIKAIQSQVKLQNLNKE